MKTLLLSIALALFALTVSGQTPAPSPAAPTDPMSMGITPNLAVGEVTAIDEAGNRINVKTKDGDIAVLIDAKTIYLKAQPGAKDLKGATPITLAEIGVGDGVIALGRVAEDKKSVPAKRVVLMTKADIAQKQEHDRQEWQRRGIVGRIVSLNNDTKEINLMMRAPGGERPVTISASDKAVLRRYAPDSVKFSDAKPSSFAELKVGDQLRALGEKSADGTHFAPEEIVSGSFRMVGGAITVINPAKNEITINNLQTSQPVTIVVNKDSLMRRIPPEMAAMIAQRQAQAAAGGGGGGQPSGQGAGNGQGRGGGNGGGGGRDFDAMLERLPVVTLADLKKGDVIAVSSTTGVDPTRVTAIKLVAGIEALMTRASGPAGQGGQAPSLNVPGLDSIGGP
ncbi:MAG TPA: hypothetical protein VGC91_15025 [Pyrinomonadaceae bacterium]